MNPIIKIDPLGLDKIDFPGYNTPWGNEVGSAANAVSEGKMSYEDGVAAIDAATGPYYSPLIFSSSLDVGVAAYGITGGSIALGILTGNGDKGLDLCAYIMACQGVGAGASGAASISGTVSNAPPSSGVSYSSGATTDVGFLLNGSATGLVEMNGKNDPLHWSATAAGGLGAGEFAGVLTCQQYTRCIVN